MSENKKNRRKRNEAHQEVTSGDLCAAVYSEAITAAAPSGTHTLRGGPQERDPVGVTGYVEGGRLESVRLVGRTVHYTMSPKGGPRVAFLYWF